MIVQHGTKAGEKVKKQNVLNDRCVSEMLDYIERYSKLILSLSS